MLFRKKRKKQQTLARKLVVRDDPKSVISEQFRTIRTNIKFSMPDEELKTVVITSASIKEGKSTTSTNIASVFAQEGKKVLIVDCDMRKPTVHYTFSLKNVIGLSNLLTRQCTLEEAIQETDIEGLSVITSGPIPPNPAELLASKQMMLVLEKLENEFDMIILDAPPVLPVTDAQILSNKCDATILVISAGETQKNAILKAKELLEHSKANIIGVIMNNVKLKKNQYYYHYYGEAE